MYTQTINVNNDFFFFIEYNNGKPNSNRNHHSNKRGQKAF